MRKWTRHLAYFSHSRVGSPVWVTTAGLRHCAPPTWGYRVGVPSLASLDSSPLPCGLLWPMKWEWGNFQEEILGTSTSIQTPSDAQAMSRWGLLGPWVTTGNRAFLLKLIELGGEGGARNKPLSCDVMTISDLLVIAAEPSQFCLVQIFLFLTKLHTRVALFICSCMLMTSASFQMCYRLSCMVRQLGSKQNKDSGPAQRGWRAIVSQSLIPGPEFAQTFHSGTKGALRSSCLTPRQLFCLRTGRSFARWLKCSCSYFVLMQTDISSSSCSGFLLWGRGFAFS